MNGSNPEDNRRKPEVIDQRSEDRRPESNKLEDRRSETRKSEDKRPEVKKPGDKRPESRYPEDGSKETNKPEDYKPEDSDKKPFNRNRSETFEERAKKLIGVTSDNEEPNPEHDDSLPHYARPTYASYPNGSPARISEIRERKATIEKETQEIENITYNKKKSITTETEDFITREKSEQRKSRPESSPDHSPTRNSRPTSKKTTESTNTHDRPNENGESTKPNLTKTTDTRNKSPEKKKPEVTKNTPEVNRFRSETNKNNQEYDKSTQEVTNSTRIKESTRSTIDSTRSTYDSTRSNQDSSKIKDSTRSTVDSTRHTVDSTHDSTRSTQDSTRSTLESIKSTQKITEPFKTGNKSPTRPETHVSTAKINITPIRGATKTTKTTIVETATKKVAPSIRLVKQPTDISSTEPDSDVETDHELIKNIDKSTGKSTRKKLIQSRKDSAPVMKSSAMTDKEKVSRSVSESVFKTDTIDKKKSDASPKKDTKRPVKCVTTKTINLTNVKNSSTINSNTLDDVVIDVQQAKSSREPSPNKIVPIPVRGDEDINGHQMIYPDKVDEPDDAKTKPKVKNIPIFEESTKQFVGLEITEVSTDHSQVILEEDEDTEKLTINSSTLERADRKRNSIQIDPIEDDDDSAHLLSVSQKVNKFISTAEELKKPKTSAPFRNDEVKLEDLSEPEDDSMLTVNRKVTKFSTISDETQRTRKTVDDVMTRSHEEVDENLRNDECLLSVQDKVNKFISSAEKIVSSAPQKSPELVKNAMKNSTKFEKFEKPEKDVNESFLTREKISTLSRENRSDSKSTLKSQASDITLKSTEAVKRARAVFENNTASRDVKRHDDILSRPSVFEAKRTPTAERKVYRETVTTTKKTVESSKSPERQSPVKDFPSKSPSPTTPRRGSSDRTPAYMRDQVSSKKDLFEKRISSSKIENEMSHQKSLSPQTSVDERNRSGSEEVQHHTVTRKISSDKHYMSHTVASLEHVNNERRDHEIHRTSRRNSNDSRRESSTRSPTKFHRNISESTNDSALESPRSPTKFGVELKRTDSRNSQTRRTSTGGESINIEEIFDLAELEKLLEVVVGYEQRRRIRAQIRVVKKIISDRKDSVSAKSTRTDKVTTNTSYSSPARVTTKNSSYSSPSKTTTNQSSTRTSTSTTSHTSYQSPTRVTTTNASNLSSKVTSNTSPTRKSRDESSFDSKYETRVTTSSTSYSSPTRVTTTTTSYSPQSKVTTNTSPTRKSRDEPKIDSKFETRTQKIVEKPEKKVSRDDSRLQKVVTTTTTTTTRTSGTGEKPREVTQTKTTRVTAEKNPSTTRGIIESLNKNSKGKPSESVVKIVKKTSATGSTQKTSSTRERTETTDCVTSSYGVGPTDSNGLPLFGLNALRKKSPVTKESKTTGSIVSEVSYSENGGPAVVERKTMKYSTDPSDFACEIDTDYKTNTSERKSSRGGVYSVTKIEKFQDDDKSTTKSITSSPSSKIIRRGSVKEIKEKLIRKGSSTKVTESTKRSSMDCSGCEGECETYTVSKGYRKASNDTKSFLNSEKKASNVKEVLSYMRNADNVVEDGDSKDDAEARALLNKFLGATALMTGIESNSGLSKEYLSSGGVSSKNQRASSGSKVTKTVTSYSTAKSYDINDIWDVDLLKKLLESTTNYDERRKIRARIRQVMADNEETMTKTSSEVQQQGDRIIKTTTTEVITKSTMQPQQKMSPFAKFKQLDRQNSLPKTSM